MVKVIAGLFLTALALSACGGSDGIEVSEVRIGEPTGPNAALYLTATSDEDDILIGAETDVASEVQMHETVMGDDGTMGMKPVQSLMVSEGEQLILEPGGLHLMLIDVDRLDVGSEVEVSLIWENAGEQVVTAEVVEPDETMGAMDHSQDDG